MFDSPGFASDPLFVQYFQMLMAALLTYHGGIQCVRVQEFTIQPPVVRLFWETKKYASFQIGELNESFTQFTTDIQRIILKLDKPSEHFSKNALRTVRLTIETYQSQVELLDRNFQKLTSAMADPMFSIRDLAQELLFIFLSTLPVEDINAFFLDIHSYFPPDLEVTLVNGNRVNVGKYFEKTAQDTSFLIDKIKVFGTLFYSQMLPIVQEIAQGRATAYVQKLLDHPATRAKMFQNLTDTRSLQLEPRIQLYRFLAGHLKSLGLD